MRGGSVPRLGLLRGEMSFMALASRYQRARHGFLKKCFDLLAQRFTFAGAVMFEIATALPVREGDADDNQARP